METCPPHRWREPAVGDHNLLCTECPYFLSLDWLAVNHYHQWAVVGHMKRLLPEEEARRWSKAFRAATDDTRRRPGPDPACRHVRVKGTRRKKKDGCWVQRDRCARCGVALFSGVDEGTRKGVQADLFA